MKYFLFHHFQGDSNLISDNIAVKIMNKEINNGLKIVTYWLNATKICLKINKTEAELFK